MKEDPYEQNPLNSPELEIYKELRYQLQDHIRRTGAIPWQ